MMSARRDWRRRIPIRRSAQDCSPLLGCSTAGATSSSYWRSRPDGDLACCSSRGTATRVVGFAEQISLMACEFTLRSRV